MEVLRELAIRFATALMYGALIPPIALLIIAYFNERLRRVLLAILFPLAFLLLVAFYIWAPRIPPTFDAWQAEFQTMRGAMSAALPLLIVLAVLAVVGILFGPALRRAAEGWLHQRTRREYLLALFEWLDSQVAGLAELEGREVPQLGRSFRITGGPGMGKSVLLRQALFEAARQALGSRERPLPVFLDLDERMVTQEGLRFERLSQVLPVQVPFLGWLLKREGKSHQLMFFVDGSVQTYGLTFASLGLPSLPEGTAPGTADQLAKLAEAYFPCPFILAMPAEASEGTLARLAEPEICLKSLDEAGVQMAGREMINKLEERAHPGGKGKGSPASGKSPSSGGQSAAFGAALRNDTGAWRVLSTRPAMLHLLARFFKKHQRLPANVRELFRAVSYPPGLQPERVEEALVQLAQQIIRTRHYQQPPSQMIKAQAVGRPQPNSARDRAQIAGLVTALVDCGLLRRFPGREPTENHAAELIAFAHPIFLAYFIALGWQQSPLAQFPAEAIFQAETVATDPVLGDALVFFNNLEADPTRLAQTLEGLVRQGVGEGGLTEQGLGRFGRFLAAQCLLAMPATARPPALLEQVAAQLLQEVAYEPSAGEQAWLLMEPLDPASQLVVYHQALAHMDPPRMEQTLRCIEERAPGTLDLLLKQGDMEFSRTVGSVWAECEPRDTLERFRALYQDGPIERRRLAVELMGRLPREAVEDDLHRLLEQEREPEVRIAVLRSLAASGADVVFTLLERIADRQEAAEVRIFAAEELAELRGPQMETGAVTREMVRVSRIPMPEPAWRILQRVLERLRGPLNAQAGAPAAGSGNPGASINEWEALANPYVVGRPVVEPHMFFGREKLLHELRASVENGTPILLTGERRCGKSSLLLRLYNTLQAEARQGIPLRSAYLDLEGLMPNEFYETTIRTLIEAMGDPNLEADPNIPRPYTDQPFGRDLSELLEYMRTKLASGPKAGRDLRVALLIDSADGFFGYPQAMHAALHRVFNACAAQGLVIILAGVDPLRIRADGHPPFYEEYRALPIPRFTDEEGQRLISEPVEGTFSYEPAAVERILEVAQGRPAEIQSLCQILVGDLLESGERVITPARVEAVLRLGTRPRSELLTQAENLLGGVMDWLEAHPEASNAQAEEQMKKAWAELQKAFIQQAARVRKRSS